MGAKFGGCCADLLYLQQPSPSLMASNFNNNYYPSSFSSYMLASRTRIARSAKSCNLTFWVVDNHRSSFLGCPVPVARHRSLDGTDVLFVSSSSTSVSTSLRRSSSLSNGLCSSSSSGGGGRGGGDGNENGDEGCEYEKNDEDFVRKQHALTNSSTKTQFEENESDNKREAFSSPYVPLPPKWVSSGLVEIAGGFMEKKNTYAAYLLPMRSRNEEGQKITRSSISSATYNYDSVKKAFSSMVFIIRELYSYTLQLREVLLLEELDLQGILSDVQKEMHSSFCWLFQQIFSCTPTLMLSVMLLLANFTVHSMSVTMIDHFPIHSDLAIAATVGEYQQHPQYQSQKSVLKSETRQEAWKRTLEAARLMQAETRHEALMDKDVLVKMVAPVSVEPDDEFYHQYYPEHFRTELTYQTALLDDPYNTLFLCNYAQFLYLVVHDHDRAEAYFKRAVEVKPVDGESLCRYANFLWMAKNDLCSAEEKYLRAIEVDPGNTSLAANYANFLWNTGGQDTCFPLHA